MPRTPSTSWRLAVTVRPPTRVRYRLPGILQPGHGKLEARWGQGLWLGKRFESDEHVIGTPEGITKCRAIAQVPASE
eukprot:2374681-Heterocapsa_arctica.AAC.1